MQNRLNRIIRFSISWTILAAGLVSCGGGGSESAPAPPPPPPPTFSIGGNVSGLIGSVILQNTGGDNLTISADGDFVFATELNNGATYSISVLTQPVGQFCGLDQASGTVSGSDVALVSVQCRPADPVLAVNGIEVKLLNFTWGDVTGETEYRLLEDLTGSSGFSLRGTLGADSEQAAIEIFVPDHATALYMVQACYSGGCVDSNVVAASDALNDAIGYVKALDADPEDRFGALFTSVGLPRNDALSSISLSADGSTLAIGIPGDDSLGTGIGSDAADNSATDSGSTYILNRVGPGAWNVQAYIKASNAEAGDAFGSAVALSNDGSTLAVSAVMEDGSDTGINGNQSDNSAADSGAAYIFVRDGSGNWAQQVYIKASNVDIRDAFGLSLDLSGDGLSLVVGAPEEDSVSIGVNGVELDNTLSASGAAYIFRSDGSGNWSQHSYVKSSNSNVSDRFGWKVVIDGAGDTLVVTSKDEDSASVGINGSELDNSISSAGAAYAFELDTSNNWIQQGYLKASNPSSGDIFGYSLALSSDGLTLAVGAPNESSGATDINGAQFDDSFPFSGAVYVFTDDGVGNWTQQSYIKASNTNRNDVFGINVALSDNGSNLAVSAYGESSNATGIGGDQFNNSAIASGAVYLFERDNVAAWSQQTYIKSPNSDAQDMFGTGLALSGDGWMLTVGASGEDGASDDRTDNSAGDAGAVFVY